MMSGAVSCEIVDDDIGRHTSQEDCVDVKLDAVAEILASVPIDYVHLHEVHSAVSSSSMNGYDEEYTMADLFSNPGAGVGEPDVESKVAEFMGNPLRKLIEEHVRSAAAVKSGGSGFLGDADPDAFLNALTDSDVQIYWPFSESWDGRSFPIVTFDPEDGGDTNVGYRLVTDADGHRSVEVVVVDEEMAQTTPVWVVNRNSDACYTSLEMLRKEDPGWGEGGGTVIVKPAEACIPVSHDTKASSGILKSLILKDFTMKRNFDPWFAGGSEFFVLTITGGCSFA